MLQTVTSIIRSLRAAAIDILGKQYAYTLKAYEAGYSNTSHWSVVTTGEVGTMVREAIKRGEQAIADEAKVNGEVHQNAK